jgi:isopentenyl-diphosphate delta-isomerase type 1
MEKMEAHQKGLLHRAFSVFLINDSNQLLLQKRALDKYHSPGLWTNTCCSHPRKNEKVIDAGHRRLFEEMGIKSELKPNGYGVIDFLNSNFVKKHLVLSETKIVDGITFFIQREIKDGYIFKNIKFKHNNQEYNFTEKVKAISLLDFKNYFREAGVNLIYSFGDYQLNEYNKENSSRLILIFN